MQGQGYEYFVTPFARFDLEAVSAQEVFAPGLERSFGELVAQLADGTDLAVDPLDAFFDPTVLDADPLIDTGELELGSAIDLAGAVIVVEPEPLDLDLRLLPALEGYGVSIQAYESIQPNPQLGLVESLPPTELVKYETALYGSTLSELAQGETGGCAAEGLAVLESEIIPALEATDDALAALDEEILNDPGYVDSLNLWRSCLGVSGIAGVQDLSDPLDAVALTQQRFQDAGTDVELLMGAREFERSVATADFDCRSRTTDLAIAAVVARAGGAYVDSLDALFEVVGP